MRIEEDAEDKAAFKVPTLADVALASFIFRCLEGQEDAHAKLVKRRALIKKLQSGQAGVEDVKKHVISEYLNKWKCRLSPNSGNAKRICDALASAGERLRSVQKGLRNVTGLPDSSADSHQDVNGDARAMACAYKTLMKKSGIGPTVASKLLGAVWDGLFVIWDRNIRLRFREALPATRVEKGQLYALFLGRMRGWMLRLDEDAERTLGGDRFEDFINAKLCGPSRSATKLLDEYNYVTITLGMQRPPRWLLDMLRNVKGQG